MNWDWEKILEITERKVDCRKLSVEELDAEIEIQEKIIMFAEGSFGSDSWECQVELLKLSMMKELMKEKRKEGKK